MKKTFTINISGSVFHIDEDAYEKLKGYLQMLNRHFGPMPEGPEILQDIESRIAELFLEKMSDGKDVIIDPWVDEVIARMGKPEDFMEAGEEQAEGRSVREEPVGTTAGKVRRRLYRDPDNRVIGGVCSGMGAYFNIDPVILRVIFVLVFFLGAGTSFLIYLVLWIAVPKARTTAQRLEMRGEEATVSNIQKSIREEMKDLGESYNKFVSSPGSEKNQSRMSRFADFVGDALKVFLRIVVLLFGAALIIGGFVALISFIASMIVGHSVMSGGPFFWGINNEFHMPGFLGHFVHSGALTTALFCIAFLVGIPILAVLFIGTKLVFRYKTNNRMIGLGAFGLWLVALIVLITVTVGQVGNFSKRTTTTSSVPVACENCKTIYLKMADNPYDQYREESVDLNNMKLISVDGKEILLGHPRLTIEKANGTEFTLITRKKARGKTMADAQENIEKIVYNFSQKDSSLVFDPYYTLKEEGKWRDQEISLILKVPEGKSVYLDEQMTDIIYDIENVENMWDGDMVGKTWTMTPDGLALKK
jgi:phage shock protein PspC (stress-responsive transcriptional regulator)